MPAGKADLKGFIALFDEHKTAPTFEVSANRHPLAHDFTRFEAHEGDTVAEIVRRVGIDPKYGIPLVVLIRGIEVTPVPVDMWDKVRPKEGTRVEVMAKVPEGGTEVIIAALASAIIPQAATWAAGAAVTAGWFATGSLGYYAVYAAVSVVGALLVHALIPPAKQPNEYGGQTNYAITGFGNALNRYGVYPSVIGRMRMFPPLTATGYSETSGQDIYYRGRMTFGYGPVALEDLRIGTTPITEFDEVQLEFLNVDRARTVANIPGIEDLLSYKSEDEQTPMKSLNNINSEYVYGPETALSSVEISASLPSLYYYNSFDFVIDRAVKGTSTWTTLDTYAGVTGDFTWNHVPTDTSTVYKYRVRLTSMSRDTNAERLNIRRPNDERPVVSKVKATTAATAPAWRYGSESMRLYPTDVTEDTYSDVLQRDQSVVKYTQPETTAASVDLTFPQGLYRTDNDERAKRGAYEAKFRFEYQSTEGGLSPNNWTDLGEKTFRAKVYSLYRVSQDMEFPAPGEYAIRVTRTTDIDDQPGDYNSATLTAIRSLSGEDVPSHENIAEVAFRIKATEQLNGQLDNLNAIVQQLAPVWDGSGWSEPQPVRHPAWQFARALMGPHVRRPVAEERIELEDLKAWADEEPHWTCDYIVDTPTQLSEVLQVISAAGRAKYTLVDFKWSIIRDQAQGPVRQMFTPRNSWGYSAVLTFPRKIHGFRVQAVSERLNWQEDEITVYNDGFNASNATELETLSLPGVVVTEAENDQGNVYKLGRYHLAAALVRPEVHSFNADWESILVTRGDKIAMVHNVPLIGVGSARVKSVQDDGTYITGVVLDDEFDLPSEAFRMQVRTAQSFVSFDANSPADPSTKLWSPSVNLSAGLISAGDLVNIQELTQVEAEFIVTNVSMEDNEVARIECVDAVPEILNADTGGIPSYNPIVTNPRNPAVNAPPKPIVISVYSNAQSQFIDEQYGVMPRIGVSLEPVFTDSVALGATLQLRWRDNNGATAWTYGELYDLKETTLFSAGLVEGQEYYVEIQSVGSDGMTLGWVNLGLVTAESEVVNPPLIIPTWTATSVKDDNGTDRRPAIALSWVLPPRGAAMAAWRVRPQSVGETKYGEVTKIGDLSTLISDGILPLTNYECSASFRTASGAYEWSDWFTLQTLDIRIDGIDIADGAIDSSKLETTLGQEITDATANANQALLDAANADAKADQVQSNLDQAITDLTVDYDATQQAANDAIQAKDDAQLAANAAATSEANAALSELNADGSADAAASSASAAATSETNAGQSASAADASKVAAQTAESNASLSETNAAASETNAAGSAAAALSSETLAAEAKDDAEIAATASANSATSAAASATDAGDSASAASDSELAAAASESNAAASAGQAVTAKDSAEAAEASASEWNRLAAVAQIASATKNLIIEPNGDDYANGETPVHWNANVTVGASVPSGAPAGSKSLIMADAAAVLPYYNGNYNGRRYLMSAWVYTGNVTSGDSRFAIRAQNTAGAGVSFVAAENFPASADTAWTYFESEVLVNQNTNYIFPGIDLTDTNGGTANLWDFKCIDITEEHNAADSAAAAVISASNASASSDDAGDFAAAASSSASTASTQAGLASNSASAAAISASDADDSAVAAFSYQQTASRLVGQGVGCFEDALFETYGDSGSMWSDFTNGPNTLPPVANQVYPVGKTLSYNYTDTTLNVGLKMGGSVGWAGPQNEEAYVVEVIFTYVGGVGISGAGVMIDWNYDGGESRQAIRLEDMITGYLKAGVPTFASAVLRRPASFPGGFTTHDAWFMVQYDGNGLGPIERKHIRLHSFQIRPASTDELRNLETSATVDQDTQTLATLDGKAQAQSGIAVTATSGGSSFVSELRQTSYANPDGTGGSIIQLRADDIIVDGTLTTSKLAVGFGGNELTNTRFWANFNDWSTNANNSVGAETDFLIRSPGATYAGLRYPTMYMVQNGTSTAGYTDIVSNPSYTEDGDAGLGAPCSPGERWEASINVSTHRCTGELRIQWVDDAGNTITYSGPVTIPTASGSSTNPDEWQRIGVRGTAPAGAAYAKIHIRKLGTLSQTSSYLFFHKPMLCECPVNATEFTPYSPGGTTFIDGDTVRTGSLLGDRVAARSMTADRMELGTLTADEIIADGITRQGVAGSSQVLNNSGTWTTICEFTLSNVPVATYLQGIVGFGMTTGPQGLAGTSWQFRVTVNGSTRLSLSYYSVPFLFTNVRYHTRPFTMQNVPAGDIVVKFQMVNMGGDGVEESNLSAIAAMR